MKKGLVAFLFALAVPMLSWFPCMADELSCSKETNSHLLYRIENNNAFITGYTGNEEVLIIPSQIGDYNVLCIDKLAFANNDKIWTVILPETVTEIREYAFHQSSIRNIILPNSLQSIRDGAFSDSRLTSVYLPTSVTEMGVSVFDSCFFLRSVKIDAHIKEIPYRSFFECICLFDVELSDSIEAIGEEAFYFCKELFFIDIPQNVHLIDDTAFFGCEELCNHPLLKEYIGN